MFITGHKIYEKEKVQLAELVFYR